MSGVAAPLLAGFSVTLMTVVAADTAKFRWPGPAILLLVAEAMLFILAVQSGFWARQYLASPADVLAWSDDDLDRAAAQAHERRGYAGFAAWARRSSTFYSLGLLTLMLGLACIVIPAAGTALDPWRWATLLVVLGTFLSRSSGCTPAGRRQADRGSCPPSAWPRCTSAGSTR